MDRAKQRLSLTPQNVRHNSFLCFNTLNSIFLGNHTARGATKEKSKKLDELKAKRRAKDQKGAVSLQLV